MDMNTEVSFLYFSHIRAHPPKTLYLIFQKAIP